MDKKQIIQECCEKIIKDCNNDVGAALDILVDVRNRLDFMHHMSKNSPFRTMGKPFDNINREV